MVKVQISLQFSTYYMQDKTGSEKDAELGFIETANIFPTNIGFLYNFIVSDFIRYKLFLKLHKIN